ncbi:MAG TPA: type I DNA topoisomerase [Polyangiaceae bacterium]|jgi:DNA topoisomerase-1|nr:type I DNA topoisomerase [Polyangiaceae bacterium]
MGKTLVVVESPAKAKTIKKYLGSSYEVMASKGHIKDLPKKARGAIDIDHGFKETFEIIAGKEKIVEELKGAAAEADEILLAPDPDREGEAIAWHLAEELGEKRCKRVEFHEITKSGVQKGVNAPRKLNKNLYDAQRARRVLDRLVGYDVSALVWSKLAYGLSAGRVQSVALRLIVDREREIEAFVPVEYWNCGAQLAPKDEKSKSFFARVNKLEVKSGDEAGKVRTDLEKAKFVVSKITKSERKRKAQAPYTTSRLQQDAVNRLGFGAKRTMQVAQGLYEGVDLGKDLGSVGLITYMRTDSVRISPEAITAVRDYIEKTYGKTHVPAQANEYKSKKAAQEAHEAIRPTSVDYPPDVVRKHLKDEQYKLYKLIWDRFVASQMVDALYDQTGVDITAAEYSLRAGGRTLKFAGWLAVYGEEAGADDKTAEDEEDAAMPELTEGQELVLVTPPGVVTEQKFTQPPPRYNEGSLVRELEERGIGRPSTYAEIISKVQARDYVEKMDARFKPTTLGKYVVDGLLQSKLDFMEPAFTSQMEEELDEVEAGKEDRVDLLSRFYKRFQMQLAPAKKGKRWNPEPEPTGETCDTCGEGEMMKRWSKNGWFLGCSKYPKCKTTRDLGPDGKGASVRLTDIMCDKCGKPMAIRSGRYGEFLSCTGYPECKNAKPVPLGVNCPKCGGDVVEIRPKPKNGAKRGGKTFYGCSNWNNESIKCDFKLWQKPINEPCPVCAAKFLVMGGSKLKPMIACANKECGYKRSAESPPEEENVKPATPSPAQDAAHG